MEEIIYIKLGIKSEHASNAILAVIINSIDFDLQKRDY